MGLKSEIRATGLYLVWNSLGQAITAISWGGLKFIWASNQGNEHMGFIVTWPCWPYSKTNNWLVDLKLTWVNN